MYHIRSIHVPRKVFFLRVVSNRAYIGQNAIVK